VVPGATHLFEEPGTLAQAARLAADFLEIRISEGERGYRSATAGGAR
jgi:putative phosphoribosyl transferase